MSEVETVVTEQAQTEPAGDATQQNAEERRFTQAELDAAIKDRLARAEKKAQEATAKAKAEAEANALKEQGKYKELHEAAAARVAELEPVKERAERLEAVLAKRWDNEKGNVPDYILPLLEKMPVDERLDYITDNREKWTKSGPPNINAGGNGGKPAARTEAEKNELAAIYGIDPRFIE
jgi:hypothetical protein